MLDKWDTIDLLSACILSKRLCGPEYDLKYSNMAPKYV